MNSYEVVKAAINFECPDRLPIEASSQGFSDTVDIYANKISRLGCAPGQTQSYDAWGCLWVRTDKEPTGQIKGHPLEEDWEALNSYEWPDADNPEYYEGLEKQFEGSEGKYVKTHIGMFLFERLQALRGLVNVMEDLYLEPEALENLMDRIVDFNIRYVQNMAERFPGKIHGIRVTDDWGTNQSTFISPALWDQFFRPRYVKMIDAIHDVGWDIWLHSCGRINSLINRFIDINVDVLNLQQPTLLGIEEIGKEYAGKICFSTTCDLQMTLPFKSDEEVEAEAKLLLESFGTEKGGVILSEYYADDMIDPNKYKVMYNAFKKYDIWNKNK